MKKLTIEKRNHVLYSMLTVIDRKRSQIFEANQEDIYRLNGLNGGWHDRLLLNQSHIDGMIKALYEVATMPDPLGKSLDERMLPNGLRVINRTVPFGTILIIYESRPDVTVEAVALAFKTGNRILLKGGKEAKHSNRILVSCWEEALAENGLGSDWVQQLELNHEETQKFLGHPDQQIDLIVARGGKSLIDFVKQYAQSPIIVSGRGNNFAYLANDADWEIAEKVVLNAKIQKVSACNALDKLLIDKRTPLLETKLYKLLSTLQQNQIDVLVEESVAPTMEGTRIITDNYVWFEEFLALRVAVKLVDNQEDAINFINRHSGGHSALIFTKDSSVASNFMDGVDCAIVYHNASSRFSDGGQLGMGAELAISTEKLHHRGPLGLDQLVTNKYYIYGRGQIRE